MANIDPTPPALLAPHSIFHKAASFCLWSPLIAFVLNLAIPKAAAQTQLEALRHTFVAGALPAAGVLAGIFALFGIARHGRRGILWKSVTGILIWVCLVMAAMLAFNVVREKARRLQQGAQQQEQRAQHRQ